MTKTKSRRLGGEAGAAVLIALLTTMLIAAVGAILVTVTTTETMISAALRQSQETACAAESAFDRALRDLDALADWDLVLLPSPANVQGSFVDGQPQPVAPDGRQLDVQKLTASRQLASNATSGPAVFGADAPSWRLFAQDRFSAILPTGLPAPPAYLLVWVADDGWDGDGQPGADANETLLVHAEAYGSGGSHRVVSGAVWRDGDGVLRVLTRRRH